jgi:hypothetical protein
VGGNAEARGVGWTLAIASVLGLALRLAYVLVIRRHDVPLESDSFFYSEGANLLVQGRGFIQPMAWQGVW